jgi:FMN reductase
VVVQIAVVVGNPKPNSRTLQISRRMAEAVCRVAGPADIWSLDLCTVAAQLFEWPDERMAELNRRVAASDVVIGGSPTYKATYTGMLKAFLDRYPSGGLDSVVAVPVMSGSSNAHSMAPEVNLRPLLIELGASTPTTSLYFVMTQMPQLDDVVGEWTLRNLEVLRRLAPSARRPGPVRHAEDRSAGPSPHEIASIERSRAGRDSYRHHLRRR